MPSRSHAAPLTGYERKWAFYKVWVMVAKTLLVVPIILFWDQVVLQSLVTLALLGLWAGFSFYSSPFINPQADVMDASGRVVAMSTVAFGLISAPEVAPDTSDLMGILINLAQAINAIVMVLMVLYGLPPVRKFIKNLLKQFMFEDTVLNQTGRLEKILPNWDVKKEVKHRVWHQFWDGLITSRFDEEVQKRFMELKHITGESGKKRIMQHFAGMQDPRVSAARAWVVNELEGVDVFWDGVPADGVLDSATGFGKMYVQPYPFHCVMVYDDAKDHTFIWQEDFDEFVAKNQSEDIRARRHIRRIIRALHGQQVHNPFQQMETHTVRDGTESVQVTDDEGNTHTEERPRFTAVQVLMTYTNGTMNVSANTDKPYSAGFKVSLVYSDGHGIAVAPHTGENIPVTNSYTMAGSDERFGLRDDFSLTPQLNKILNETPENTAKWQAGLPHLDAADREYRAELAKRQYEKESVMNSAFWLQVYDRDDAPREEIEHYLRTYELNPALKSLPDDHAGGLDYLYNRMKYCRAHPCAALWFVVFEDLWEHNKDVECVAAHPELFNPANSSSLAYKPKKRPEFESLMEENGARTATKFFSDKALDALYARLDELDQKHMEAGTRV